MAQKTTVGVRLPQDYLEEIDAICQATGKSRSDVLLEAVAAYIGKELTSGSVQSTLEQLQSRVDLLEKKLVRK
ncbi:MAG: ribbon-helix-helix domain-containing protein [Scytonema sp. PMC 1070.18]|nr:ribbon-helix-helix domain-containing protein [Scytonema sp. PMC 1070.18]